MTDAERMQLHADLARLLAPAVGEDAVYEQREVFVCPTHGEFASSLDILVDNGLWCRECGLKLDMRDVSKPQRLTDPAVLFPLVEDLANYRYGMLLGIQISRMVTDERRVYWQACMLRGLDEWCADGTTMEDAVALALRSALEGERASEGAHDEGL